MREYDLATVCRWIGNSPAVAAKRNATSVDLDADFHRAVGTEAQQKAQQKAQQSPAGADSETTRENKGEVTPGPLCAGAVGEGGWALQDSNL